MILNLKSNSDLLPLIEVSRRELVTKQRQQAKQRFNKRLRYQVSNFRGVDLEQMFENDYFVFTTPIKDYECTIAFPGVFSSLKNVVRSTGGDPDRINLQMVIRALRQAFDATDDVKVRCTCADFYYRYSYQATQNGYLYGEPQNIPAPITNPNDDIGSVCKHLSLLLSNKNWLVKAASVVNSFIKTYPEKAANYLYDTYSAPDVEIEDDEDAEYADELYRDDYSPYRDSDYETDGSIEENKLELNVDEESEDDNDGEENR